MFKHFLKLELHEKAKKSLYKDSNYKLIFLKLSLFIFIAYLNLKHKEKSNSQNIYINELINQINSARNISDIIFNYPSKIKYDKFNENINKLYIQLQNNFCEKENESLIEEYENKITQVNANFGGKSFDLFVYKSNDIISESITILHNWEEEHTTKIVTALEYYAKKKKLKNKDIYLLDIGSNIGWYTYSI